jgi:hypothetical protein
MALINLAFTGAGSLQFRYGPTKLQVLPGHFSGNWVEWGRPCGQRIIAARLKHQLWLIPRYRRQASEDAADSQLIFIKHSCQMTSKPSPLATPNLPLYASRHSQLALTLTHSCSASYPFSILVADMRNPDFLQRLAYITYYTL